jgi:hypothetical protein
MPLLVGSTYPAPSDPLNFRGPCLKECIPAAHSRRACSGSLAAYVFTSRGKDKGVLGGGIRKDRATPAIVRLRSGRLLRE